MSRLRRLALEIWNYPEHSFEEIVNNRTMFKYVISNFLKTKQFTSTDKRPLTLYEECINSDEFIEHLNKNLFLNITDKNQFIQDMKQYLKNEYALKNYYINCIKNNPTFKFLMTVPDNIFKNKSENAIENNSQDNSKDISEDIVINEEPIKQVEEPLVVKIRKLLKDPHNFLFVLHMILTQSKHYEATNTRILHVILKDITDAFIVHANFYIKLFKYLKLNDVQAIRDFCKNDNAKDLMVPFIIKELNPSVNNYAWEAANKLMLDIAKDANCASISLEEWTRNCYKFIISSQEYLDLICSTVLHKFSKQYEDDNLLKQLHMNQKSRINIIDGYDLSSKKDKVHSRHKLKQPLDKVPRDYAFAIVNDQLFVSNIAGTNPYNIHIQILKDNLDNIDNIPKTGTYESLLDYIGKNAKLVFGIICNKSFIVFTRVNVNFGYATNIITNKYPNVKVYDYHSQTEFERLAKRM